MKNLVLIIFFMSALTVTSVFFFAGFVRVDPLPQNGLALIFGKALLASAALTTLFALFANIIKKEIT